MSTATKSDSRGATHRSATTKDAARTRLAVDTLLVTRSDTPLVVVYDLLQSLLEMAPLLAAQRPDIAIDELETFDLSHVTFPVHAGTLAFRARNDPGFAERASSIFDVVITIVVAAFTALFALVRFVRGARWPGLRPACPPR